MLTVTIATVTDLRSRRIPNWLVLPFLAAGVVVSAVSGGWHGMAQSAMGLSLGGGLMGVLYWLGGTGMGDVKLCAAVGAWIGPQQLSIALVAMAVTGGVMALLWAAAGGELKKSLAGASELIFWAGKRGLRPHASLTLANPAARRMPYAPAIALGTIFSFFTIR